MQIENNKAKVNFNHLPVIDGLPSQMERLFLNLIGNSIKFRKQNARPVIKIESELSSAKELGLRNFLPQKKFVVIKISDNGIGFEQKFSDRIFVLFQRLHGRSEFEGTGIGLAICKKI